VSWSGAPNIVERFLEVKDGTKMHNEKRKRGVLQLSLPFSPEDGHRLLGSPSSQNVEERARKREK